MPLFLSVNMTGLNKLVYGFLGKFESFQNYFTSVCPWLASICVMMTIGMGVWKIMWDMANPKEFFVKLLMSLCFYFVLLGIYPIAMKGIIKLGMNLGYGAVFEGGAFEIEFTQSEQDKGKTVDGFYKWFAQEGGSLLRISDKQDNETAAKQALNFNLIDRDSGYIDLNKVYLYPLVFFKIFMSYVPKLTVLNFYSLFFSCGLMIIAVLIFVVVMFMIIVNYVMCLLDYFAFCGYGILMLPLSLWEGTKEYTQTLFGSVGKILIKLMVISSVVFIDVMTATDAFVEIYKGVVINGTGLGDRVVNYILGTTNIYPACLNIIIQSIFMYAISKEVSSIAGFITGGNPQMSFGEFANATKQAVRNVAGGATLGRGMSNGIKNAGHSVTSAISQGVAASKMGGSFGSAFGGAIGGSLATGAGNLTSKLAKSASPGNLMRSTNKVLDQLGMGGATLGAEEASGLPFRGQDCQSDYEGGSRGSEGSSSNSSIGGNTDIRKGNNALGSGSNQQENQTGKVGDVGGISDKSSIEKDKENSGLGSKSKEETSLGQVGKEDSLPSLASDSYIPSEDYNSISNTGRNNDINNGSDTSSLALQNNGDAQHVQDMNETGLSGAYGNVDEKYKMNKAELSSSQGASGALERVSGVLGSHGSQERKEAFGKMRQWANLNANSSDAGNRSLAKVLGGVSQFAERRQARMEAKEVGSAKLRSDEDEKKYGIKNPQAQKDWNNLSGTQKEMAKESSVGGFFKDIGNSVESSLKGNFVSKLNENGGIKYKTHGAMKNEEIDNAVKHSGGIKATSVANNEMNGEMGNYRFMAQFSENDSQRIGRRMNVDNQKAGFDSAIKSERQVSENENKQKNNNVENKISNKSDTSGTDKYKKRPKKGNR